MELSISEAAKRLGVCEDTVRRRIRNGLLQAHRQVTPQGYMWRVELDDEGAKGHEPSGEAVLRELIGVLQIELEARRREIQELHILLQSKALPAHKSWWQRLIGK